MTPMSGMLSETQLVRLECLLHALTVAANALVARFVVGSWPTNLTSLSNWTALAGSLACIPQLTAPIDNTKPLDKHELKFVQEVLGTLLYYARAVDCTMLPAIGTLASQQANGTQATLQNVRQLLDYCATHPDATIPYSASNMVLNVESDASYPISREEFEHASATK
jgi:hypothetical protein